MRLSAKIYPKQTSQISVLGEYVHVGLTAAFHAAPTSANRATEPSIT